MSADNHESAAAELPSALAQPLALLAEQLSKGSEISDADFVDIGTSLANLKVAELKEIAKFLDVRLTGATRKPDIVERLVSMSKIGLAGAADTSSSAGSVGLRHISQSVRDTISSLPRFNDVTDWCKDFSAAVNRFHFMDLLTYLVYGRDKTFDMESMKAFRSLKAYQFFADGFVKNVWSKQYPVSGEKSVPISYIRAYVHHSLSCDTPLTVYVSLNTQTGEVYSAQCNCIAGLGEACNHVAALLFFIDSAAKKNLVDLPVELSKTSQPMRWNQPPKKHVDPQPLANMDFVKACHGITDDEVERKQQRADFDPRAPSHRQVTATDALALQATLAAGGASSNACGFFHFWHAEELPGTCTAVQPTDLSQLCLFDPATSGETYEHALDRCTGPLTRYGVTQAEVEAATKGQTDNALWFDLRRGRLTSSRFGDIVHSKSKEPVSLLAGIMGYTTISALPPAMRWGVENEPTARDLYVTVALEGGKNITVRECGLSLHPDHHFIGASSDGIVLEELENGEVERGCLEIKCLFSIQGTSIVNLTASQIAQQFPGKSCLECHEDGSVHLSRRHKYYDQVVGEMAVMGAKWCDFVVFTCAGIHVERIMFEDAHWQTLLAKLTCFYKQFVIPELCSHELYISKYKS